MTNFFSLNTYVSLLFELFFSTTAPFIKCSLHVYVSKVNKQKRKTFFCSLLCQWVYISRVFFSLCQFVILEEIVHILMQGIKAYRRLRFLVVNYIKSTLVFSFFVNWVSASIIYGFTAQRNPANSLKKEKVNKKTCFYIKGVI